MFLLLQGWLFPLSTCEVVFDLGLSLAVCLHSPLERVEKKLKKPQRDGLGAGRLSFHGAGTGVQFSVLLCLMDLQSPCKAEIAQASTDFRVLLNPVLPDFFPQFLCEVSVSPFHQSETPQSGTADLWGQSFVLEVSFIQLYRCFLVIGR